MVLHRLGHPPDRIGALSSVRIVLTVANFNTHAGIDGWGRPFDLLSVCRDLDADVMVLEECWTAATSGAPGVGQAEQIAGALGYEVVTCALAEGRRAYPHPEATDKWMPPQGFRTGRNPLYFDSQRPYAAHVTGSARFAEAERGSWGIAVLTRAGLDVERTRILHLPQLRRDRVRRAAIVVDLTVEEHPISVIGTHMSHLEFGSHRHYAALKNRLRTEARPDAVLLGDMNLWGPPVRVFLPQWHRAVKGRTWPARNPHSQIDHILVRGAVRIVAGEVLPDAGSDHRPVRAELALD
jgi:endonuclease/exonuclease/phosphatase family metal-dependent hydrolase